jgi:predicted phage-related endonuclease
MPITSEQREQRKRYLGSSDAGVLAGVDQYRNMGDLYLDKRGELVKDDSNPDTELGTDMEDAILTMFTRRMSLTITRNVFCDRFDSGFPACANLDAGVRDAAHDAKGDIAAVVEAKYTSMSEEWGEGPGDVPYRVATQVQWQMWVTGCRLAYVPVFFVPPFGRANFRVYQVERHDDLINELVERGRIFWNDYVMKGIPPGDTVPHLETLKRRRREPESLVALDEDVAELWCKLAAVKQQISGLETDEKGYKEQIINALGGAEAGSLIDGRVISFREQNGARHCDFDRLELELRAIQGKIDLAMGFLGTHDNGGHFPHELEQLGQVDLVALYEKLVRQGRHRTLRIKAAPKLKRGK